MDLHLKFGPGQTVWVMQDNRPREARIATIKILIEHKDIKPKVQYFIESENSGPYSESNIFY